MMHCSKTFKLTNGITGWLLHNSCETLLQRWGSMNKDYGRESDTFSNIRITVNSSKNLSSRAEELKKCKVLLVEKFFIVANVCNPLE